MGKSFKVLAFASGIDVEETPLRGFRRSDSLGILKPDSD